MQIENKKLEPAILVKKGMDFLIPVDSRQYYRFFSTKHCRTRLNLGEKCYSPKAYRSFIKCNLPFKRGLILQDHLCGRIFFPDLQE